MPSTYRSPSDWPEVARAVAEATVHGICAARDHDLEELGAAVETLMVHADAARAVHGHLVRELLETSYQDGLDGDDISEVLARTVADAGRWGASVDPTALALVLTGALGVTPDTADGATQLATIDVINGALLVGADLAAGAAVDPEEYVTRAVGELRRAQTVEMP